MISFNEESNYSSNSNSPVANRSERESLAPDSPTAIPTVDELMPPMIASAATSAIASDSRSAIPGFLGARHDAGWGLAYEPPTRKHDYNTFRRICDNLLDEVKQLDQFVDGEVIADEASGIEARILDLLDKQLYECKWGEGESLKSVVSIILAQLNNVDWRVIHYRLLADVIPMLRTRYIIDTGVTESVQDVIDRIGLEQFRGSVTETDLKHRYKVVREDEI